MSCEICADLGEECIHCAQDQRDRLTDLLIEATRQDYGTPGWRKRAREAIAFTTNEES